jgi:hypothetical protein
MFVGAFDGALSKVLCEIIYPYAAILPAIPANLCS